MTKNQKIWFSIFLAIFVVPEVLWSPLGNFYYGVMQDSKPGGYYHEFRNNFLTDGDNVVLLNLVLLAQFLFLFFALFVFVKSKIKNIFIKRIVILGLSILVLASGFVVLFVFNFNPQIG